MTWFWFAAGRDDDGYELHAVKSSKAQNRSTGSFRRKAITFHRKYRFPQSKLYSYEKSPISRLKLALYTPQSNARFSFIQTVEGFIDLFRVRSNII